MNECVDAHRVDIAHAAQVKHDVFDGDAGSDRLELSITLALHGRHHCFDCFLVRLDHFLAAVLAWLRSFFCCCCCCCCDIQLAKANRIVVLFACFSLLLCFELANFAQFFLIGGHDALNASGNLSRIDAAVLDDHSREVVDVGEVDGRLEADDFDVSGLERLLADLHVFEEIRVTQVTEDSRVRS